MNEKQAEYWASFSHQRAGAVFLLFLVTVAFAIVFSVIKKIVLANPERAQLRWPIQLAKIGKWAAGLSFAVLLVSQMHLFCAVTVSIKGDCMSNLRNLAVAESLYANDNNDFVLSTKDWITRLNAKDYMGGKDFKCPGSNGPVSYALNGNVEKKSLEKFDSPELTALVFDADKSTVGGIELLASDRHSNRPFVAFLDGHVSPVPQMNRSKIKW